jgi:hypothetical protein
MPSRRFGDTATPRRCAPAGGGRVRSSAALTCSSTSETFVNGALGVPRFVVVLVVVLVIVVVVAMRASTLGCWRFSPPSAA